jgi:hypothetical protein
MSSSKSTSATTSSSSGKKKELSKKDQQTQSKALAKEQKRKKQEQKALKKEKKKTTKQKQQKGNDNEDEDDDDMDDDEFEKIVAELLARDTDHNAVTIDKLPGEPNQPRACFSMTLAGTNPQDGFVIFGGEYFDGATSKCFDDLLRFRFLSTAAAVGAALTPAAAVGLANGEWRKITSPNSPPPRCAHASCITPTHMYIFGGEFSTAWRFHHYNDLWRLDLKTNQWQSLPTLNGPSPRSGCRMVAWKNYLILFGGFYEASRGVRWHDDLYFYDLRNEKWSKAKFATSAQQSPSARSGFQFQIHPNKPIVFLYGGYAKVATSVSAQKGRSLDDMWMLHLSLPTNASKSSTAVFPECKWEYLPKKGAAPSKRSGASSCAHKNRLLLFGGVSDTETANDVVGEFHNSLYAFDMDRLRWYELGLKVSSLGTGSGGGKKGSRRNQQKRLETGSIVTASTTADSEQNEDATAIDDQEDERDEEEDDDNDDDGAAAAFGLRDDAFYVIIDGKFVLVEDDGEDEEQEAVRKNEEAGEQQAKSILPSTKQNTTGSSPTQAVPTDEMAALSVKTSPAVDKSDTATIISNIGSALTSNSTREEVVKPAWNGLPAPSPRITGGICVLNNRLIVYGGTAEVGDIQLTYDDMWALDLNKMDAWIELSSGTWREQQWSGVKAEDDEEDDDEESSDDDEDEDEEGGEGEEEDEEGGDEEDEDETEANVRALAEEIKELRDELGVEDFNTPSPSETMKDFFRRTLPHWLEDCARRRALEEDDEKLSGKELREKAFKLAKRRFDLLSPLLEKLNSLQEAQRLAEEEAAEEARALAEKMARRKAKKALKKQAKKD